MNLIEYADREMLVMNVANALAGELRNCLATHETVSFAVPGGTTPGPIFDLMSATDLDWSRVHVMLTDERWVPEDHEQSNTKLVKDRLLSEQAAQACFIDFYRDGLTAAEGCEDAAPTLESRLPLSLLLLGMGADMHTASLFPGAEGLEVAMSPNAPLLSPIYPAGHDIARVTLPAHMLEGAMSKHLVIFGADKRTALEQAMTLPPDQAPIGAVIGGGTVHWAA